MRRTLVCQVFTMHEAHMWVNCMEHVERPHSTQARSAKAECRTGWRPIGQTQMEPDPREPVDHQRSTYLEQQVIIAFRSQCHQLFLSIEVLVSPLRTCTTYCIQFCCLSLSPTQCIPSSVFFVIIQLSKLWSVFSFRTSIFACCAPLTCPSSQFHTSTSHKVKPQKFY